MEIKIGCNTLYSAGRLSNEDAFTLPHQLRALEIIADAGFDAVEYSHASVLTLEELAQVAERTRALGLIPWSVHAWTPLAADDAQVEPTLAAFQSAAEIARALGTRVVVVHSAGGMDPARLEERKRANQTTLRALAEAVGPETVVAVENMRSLADWEFLLNMVATCGAANVGVNIDTGHANLGDLGVVRAIEMAGAAIQTTHLQDNFGERDDHLPPGLGQIDFVAALAAFRKAGYTGVYMVEISDCPSGREPDAVADTQAAARNLRSFLAQAGF
ncbi:MAG: sugar phosphate isomerase/epimerase [Armatimonadetes bacterium]|nr:sugar phosphate isomerase/epimerase [Armatimonadota bacterium]